MRILMISIICFPLLAIGQWNQDSVMIHQMEHEIMNNGKAYDLLRELTKDIGGRLAGSPQQHDAAIWGKLNMEAFHPDKVYFQPCKTPNWQRGGTDYAAIIGVNGMATHKKLAVMALGNSLASKRLVTGDVMAVADFAELEKRKAEVKGKIVYFNSLLDPDIVQTGKAYEEAYRYRSEGPSLAAKYGAIGVMIHSLSTAEDNEPQTGVMEYNDSFPKIPAIALGPNDAKALYAQAKKSVVKAEMQTWGYFLPDADENNVVAEIRGSDYPNEIITIGGHLDSWDVNEGAHDDGTGVVQTMEVLRAMKQLNYHPKHTIRFVLFANEENGGRGGLKYAELAKSHQEKQILALESDDGGFTPRAIGVGASKAQLQKFQNWNALLKPYGTEVIAGGGGADIEPLTTADKQVILCSLLPDSQRYFDLHHAKTDVFENVNKRELLLGAVNMAAFIYLVDKYGVEAN
jgi:carboxypeptidase Q